VYFEPWHPEDPVSIVFHFSADANLANCSSSSIDESRRFIMSIERESCEVYRSSAGSQGQSIRGVSFLETSRSTFNGAKEGIHIHPATRIMYSVPGSSLRQLTLVHG
jgi:hypothetical protein